MSLTGRLEDVSLVDILQFIKFSGRTGTIELSRDGDRARIGLWEGNILSAHAPGAKRIGECLVSRGVLAEEMLERAVAQQSHQTRPLPIGQLLVEMGAVRRDDVVMAFQQQIEEVMSVLLAWDRGSFRFDLDALEPVDDLVLSPTEVTDLNLNTQQVLLEAARQLDERTRAAECATLPSTQLVDSPLAVAKASSPPRDAEPESAKREEDAGVSSAGSSSNGELQVVSSDPQLVQRLVATLGRDGRAVAPLSLDRARVQQPGETPSAVVVDVRRGSELAAALPAIKTAHRGVAVVAVAEPDANLGALYAAGATSVVDGDVETIQACVDNVAQQQRTLSGEDLFAEGLSAGFSKLRRLIKEIRTGVLSATASLGLLNLIADCVERAVLFLVRENELVVLGAFGHTTERLRLAERTGGVRLSKNQAGVLWQCATDGQARSMPCDEADLPSELMTRIGFPRSRLCALFPVPGADRVVAVVYTDNGGKNWPLEEIEFLELAVAQMGLAFENELLRRTRLRSA